MVVGYQSALKTTVIAVLGGLVTLAGIALLVLPGPGFVLVAAGLAVLATRVSWAKKPLDYAKDKAQEGVEEVGRSPLRAAGAAVAALVLVALGVLALMGWICRSSTRSPPSCSSSAGSSWSGRSSSRVARRGSSRRERTAPPVRGAPPAPTGPGRSATEHRAQPDVNRSAAGRAGRTGEPPSATTTDSSRASRAPDPRPVRSEPDEVGPVLHPCDAAPFSEAPTQQPVAPVPG